MSYPTYLAYDICGGVLWVGTMILGGYFLGRSIPNISQKIHYVILVVIFLSLVPVMISLWNARRGAKSPTNSAVPVKEV